MQSLRFPSYSFQVKSAGQRKYIFDNIRRRYVVLTPEEWVRQHLIAYLVEDRNYPASLIAVEMPLKINRMERRADMVLFSKHGNPLLIAECKAPAVKITQAAFDQAARYNIGMKVRYMIVSNGLDHYCAKLDHLARTWEFLESIPGYQDIVSGSLDL